MALFESYERRIDKINGVLAQYGIGSVEECRELCKAKGFDPYEIVKGIQPICFENACWAYTVGAAIALKSGVTTAAEAAKKIGEGLQSFCAVSEVQAAAPENSGSQKSTGFNVKKLLSPGILSAFLAIGIYLLDIRLPQHAVSLFSTIGVTTTPLAMIVIGSTLAGVKFSTVFTDKELYLFSFLKLLVLPMITFFVLRFFIKDRTLLEISTILSGCPIAGNVSMLCMEYNRDVTLVSKGICISTLLSMISIPIVSALVAIL